MTDLPYRRSISERCAFCETTVLVARVERSATPAEHEPAEDTPLGSRCRRCGRPLCAAHAHGRRTRCRACEEEYEHGFGRTVALSGGVVWVLAALLIVARNVVGIELGAIVPVSPAALGVGLFLVLAGTPPLALAVRRWIFLARKP